MFERFTESAREAVTLAQEEARTANLGYVGAEYLLLGLVREEEGLAAKILNGLDVTTEKVRVSAARRVGVGDEPRKDGKLPFTLRAQKVLETALREALSLGHNYIGTEHILLGLVRERNNIGVEILRNDFHIDPEKIRYEVIRMLSGPSAPVLKKPHVVDQEKLDEKAQVARDRLGELRHNTENVFSRSVAVKLMVEAIEQARKHPHRKPEKIAQGILVMNDKD